MALGEQHMPFLAKVRFGFDKQRDWDEFNQSFIESVHALLLPLENWTISAVRKLMPTLRDEISRDVYTGFEDGVVALFICRRIQTYVDSVKRWAARHNASSPEHYDYITTAILSLHGLYRHASQPAWVHDVLYEVLRTGRVTLRTEKSLENLLRTFANSMGSIRKAALDPAQVKWWHIHIRVHVRLYQLLSGDQNTLRRAGLRSSALRQDVVQIFETNSLDRDAFPLIMNRIRDAIDVDGVPFRLQAMLPNAVETRETVAP